MIKYNLDVGGTNSALIILGNFVIFVVIDEKMFQYLDEQIQKTMIISL